MGQSKEQRVAAIITAEKDFKVWMALGASRNEYIVEEFGGNSFELTIDDLRALIAAAKGGAA